MNRLILFCCTAMILSSPAMASDSSFQDDPYLKDRISHERKMEENVERWLAHYEEYKIHRFDPENGLGIQKNWMIDQREHVDEPMKYWELNPVF